MPIDVPTLDTRTWEQLRDELLARIPSHTPDWTNQNAADPGVTLLELFAFLGESILYRANRIPERNRLAFLKLLGRPLLPGTPAHALVQFTRAGSGGASTVTLAGGLELRAGKVAFHLDAGLDVLPVDSLVCVKEVVEVSEADEAEYRRLYATFLDDDGPSTLSVYRTRPLGAEGLTFGDRTTTVDGCVWIALLKRKADPDLTTVRTALAGRTLNLGIVLADTWDGVDLVPEGVTDPASQPGFKAEICTGTGSAPTWHSIGVARGVFAETGTTDLVLPSADKLVAWPAPELLDHGVGDVPPAFDNESDNDRLICWIRLSPEGDPRVPLQWIGVNAAMATQGDKVWSESVGTGNATPEQRFQLAKTPVVAGSLRVWVDDAEWGVVDDVGVAPREGAEGSEVASLDAEAGTLRFGDGLAGARPPRGAAIRVSYEVNAGIAGNLGTGSLSSVGVTSVKVENPVPTWGGTAPETLSQGETQVARWLQHNDRLVTRDDFQVLTLRTPGVDIARVEVLPSWHPTRSVVAGDAPGCVTLLVIPPIRATGEAPRPSDAALSAICAWLEPRRLITTELLLRGPEYVSIVVSVGIQVKAELSGSSGAEVRAAVRTAIQEALSPVPVGAATGWALGRRIRAAELFVVVANVPGVQVVEEVLLAGPSGAFVTELAISGLQLPWLAAIGVAEGMATPLATLTTHQAVETTAALPVPAVPERCA